MCIKPLILVREVPGGVCNNLNRGDGESELEYTSWDYIEMPPHPN